LRESAHTPSCKSATSACDKWFIGRAVKSYLQVKIPLNKGGDAEGVGVVMWGSKRKTRMLMALGIVTPANVQLSRCVGQPPDGFAVAPFVKGDLFPRLQGGAPKAWGLSCGGAKGRRKC
jgi:hypothetical protein